MKTILLYSVLMGCMLISTAQVGIGNIDPKATLDITTSNVATPSNTDGILIPRIDNFPTPAPTAAQDGMMIFATGTGTPAKGFYYWDSAGAGAWIAVAGVGGSDDDWYISGTSNAPAAITDNIVTQGTVTVGNSLAGGGAKLNVNSNDTNATTFRIDNSGTISLENRGMIITNNSLSGTATERFVGILTALSSSDNFSQTGLKSEFDNMSLGGFYYGVLNEFQAGGNNGYQRGFRNYFGGGEIAYGIENVFPGAFTYSGGTYGVFNQLQSQGNGTKYGVYSNLSGSGTGAKYGIYTTIDNAAGGAHYGIYIDAQKATGYAGYFIGRTSLGNATSNRFLMPAADGAAGQVMTTDGSGQVNFTDPVIGAEQINDLSDAKSDNDGTDNGSSLFLGIGAGAADDSSNNFNVGIGFQSLQQTTSGYANVGVGHSSLLNNTTGLSNVGLGWSALFANTIGVRNIGIGEATLLFNTTGDENIAIGTSALQNNINGDTNTAIGVLAGWNNMGDANVFLGYTAGRDETGSNKLYIDNSSANASNALLYGEFDNDILRTNGEFQIGDPAGTGYSFPIIDGTTGQALLTDGAGNVTFQDIPGDGTGTDDQNLVAPTLSGTTLNLNIEGGTGTSIDLSPIQDGTGTDDQTINAFGLSGDTLGISLEDDGQPVQTVDLSNLSFNVNNFALARITLSPSSQAFVANNGQYINFSQADFDLTSNFNTSTDRFEVTEAGYYRIEASFGTSSSYTATNLFFIEVRVNGVSVKTSRANHNGSGPIYRYVSTILQLVPNDYIEIFAFGQSAFTINSGSTLSGSEISSFVVERIR